VLDHFVKLSIGAGFLKSLVMKVTWNRAARSTNGLPAVPILPVAARAGVLEEMKPARRRIGFASRPKREGSKKDCGERGKRC
jgi:hypothetical protein